MVYGAKITVVRRNIAKLPDRRRVSSTQRRRHARYTGSKARIGGKLPLKRSTSTVVS
jgi:hypothetical protein